MKDNQNFKNLNEFEEQKYIELKEKGSKAAEYKLIEHHLSLVAGVVKKIKEDIKQHEDLTSIGVIGLIKAINDYDYTEDVSLATYAKRYIKNEVVQYLKHNYINQQILLLEETVMEAETGEMVTIKDLIPSQESNVEQIILMKERLSTLPSALKLLDDEDRKLIQKRYYENQTQAEIAKELGVSQTTISKREKKALIEMRNLIQSNQIESIYQQTPKKLEKKI